MVFGVLLLSVEYLVLARPHQASLSADLPKKGYSPFEILMGPVQLSLPLTIFMIMQKNHLHILRASSS